LGSPPDVLKPFQRRG